MQLPKKISPCPIIESTVEIRFEASIHPQAIFGILFNEFKEELGNVENLPILQIPEEVTSQDPTLIFQPHFRTRKGNIIYLIGPRVISLVCINDYVGWQSFYGLLNQSFERIKKLKVFEKIDRLGIRYINYFSDDIFSNIKLNCKLENEPLKADEMYLRINKSEGIFKEVLQLANNANFKHFEKDCIGSIFDIDVSIEDTAVDIYNNLNDYIAQAHEKEKEVFFSFLKSDFLLKLNPEY